jgi:hypothetical protein
MESVIYLLYICCQASEDVQVSSAPFRCRSTSLHSASGEHLLVNVHFHVLSLCQSSKARRLSNAYTVYCTKRCDEQLQNVGNKINILHKSNHGIYSFLCKRIKKGETNFEVTIGLRTLKYLIKLKMFFGYHSRDLKFLL